MTFIVTVYCICIADSTNTRNVVMAYDLNGRCSCMRNCTDEKQGVWKFTIISKKDHSFTSTVLKHESCMQLTLVLFPIPTRRFSENRQEISLYTEIRSTVRCGPQNKTKQINNKNTCKSSQC